MNTDKKTSANYSPGEGLLALVLHAHLPYVRHLEHDDALEERWLFEAITETYIPLLLVLDGLVEDGIDFRLTLSLSPTLAAMLEDSFLKWRYVRRLEGLLELAQNEISRTRTHPELNALAIFYEQRLVTVHDAFVNRYEKNLVAAFKRLQDLGKIEIMASAATHGYLPLLAANASAARAQIKIGVNYYQELFGRQPRGFWLPECGFSSDLDRLLAEQGIEFTVLETHGLTRAHPRPKYGGNAPLSCPAGTVVFGRDPEASQQVWSSVHGYPGDYDYREFYRDIAYELDFNYVEGYIHQGVEVRTDTGFKYYRITGNTDQKAVYGPESARRKAEQHAEDFLKNRLRQIEYLTSVMDRPPIIVAPYDAELFGHWWFEGPMWLDFLIRKSSRQQKMRLVSMSEYLDAYPVSETATPSASSWGHNGTHETWLNESNDWIYPHLHHGAQAMKRLADKYPQAQGLTLRALNQAARELLLAQASDWAFMINAGKMSEYATKRTKAHLRHFKRLEKDIESGSIDEGWLSVIECRNNIFPRIDYRGFC